ncbi:MAG TPA: TRAM domain-containing protein, partial [Candidatus Atribacteria bacterium]|nr:TRAM domain-containing protein [Candidatus Atribacteria bacterium]
LIDEIRSKIPDIVIRTSFIVGFPGEGEDEFYELKDFLEQQKFQWVGVFLYSREEGTYASNMKNQVSEEVKIQRKNSLMALQKRITDSLNKKRVGKQEDVLIEREENGLLIGRTRKEAPEVDGKIYLYRGKREYIGKIKRVQIINSNFYDLKGIFIE